MDVKVSVIVPIYNVEDYLSQCIDSILNQTYQNIELVLVNDGSTDSCGEICNRYAENDKRIRCIHIPNSGVMNARKRGIDIASGEYTLFVDGDDWIDRDEVERLIDISISNAYPDMIAFGMIEEYEANSIIRKNAIDLVMYTGEKLSKRKQKILMTETFFEWGFLPNLCCKLIKSAVVCQWAHKVSDIISYGEDAVCSFLCILAASSIYVCDFVPYHYRQREGSAVKELRELPKQLFREIYQVLGKAFCGMKDNQQDLRLYMFFILMLKGYSYLLTDGRLLFPFVDIEKGSRVIVYCAGGFGRVMYEYVCTSPNFTAVGWTDTKAGQYQEQGFAVQAAEEVLQKEYDYIVIAILRENTARQIAADLCQKGVPMKKIKYIEKKVLQEMELPEWLVG